MHQWDWCNFKPNTKPAKQGLRGRVLSVPNFLQFPPIFKKQVDA